MYIDGPVYIFDENVTLDDFVGTDIWVKVVVQSRYSTNDYYYINIISKTPEHVYISAIPASVIEYYDMYELNYDSYLGKVSAEKYISKCLTCGYPTDYFELNYVVCTPYQLLTTEEIIDALNICKSQFSPEDSGYYDEDEEE